MYADRPDLGIVLEHYDANVPAKFGWASMRCIFHDDHIPSAAVNVAENRFYCFTCGISEDSIGVIMLKEGIDFVSALAFATEVFGTGDEPISAKPTSRRVLS